MNKKLKKGKLLLNMKDTGTLRTRHTILIDIADACSLKCVMCDRGKGLRGQNFIKDSDFKSLVDWLKESEPKAEMLLPFWTGESTMHPQFPEFVKYLIRKNSERKIAKSLGLDTNLQTLDDYSADLIIDSGQFNVLTFSLDAATESTYQKIRIGGSLEKAERQAIRILDRKKKTGSEFPVLVFQFIVRPENYFETSAFIKKWQNVINSIDMNNNVYWHYNKPDNFKDQSIFIRRCDAPRGRSELQKEYSDLHIDTLSEVLKQDKSDFRINTPEYRPLPDGSDALTGEKTAVRKPCSGPFTHFAIRYDMRVSLCCQDINSVNAVGTAVKESFDSLWNGDKAIKLRSVHLKGDLEAYPGCASCFGQIYPGLTNDEWKKCSYILNNYR